MNVDLRVFCKDCSLPFKGTSQHCPSHHVFAALLFLLMRPNSPSVIGRLTCILHYKGAHANGLTAYPIIMSN